MFKRVTVSRNQLIQVYIVERKSGLETARLLGISRTTLSRYLKRFGIQERSVSESMRGRTLSDSHREKVTKNLKQYRKLPTLLCD